MRGGAGGLLQSLVTSSVEHVKTYERSEKSLVYMNCLRIQTLQVENWCLEHISVFPYFSCRNCGTLLPSSVPRCTRVTGNSLPRKALWPGAQIPDNQLIFKTMIQSQSKAKLMFLVNIEYTLDFHPDGLGAVGQPRQL